MSTAARARRARRERQITRDQYRSYARVSGVRPRLRKTVIAVDVVLLVVAVIFVFVSAPRVAGALGAGIAQFGTNVGDLFPSNQGTKPIDIPTTGAQVSTSLPLDGVPDYVRDPSLKVSGKVPSFLLAPGQTVEISLNGAIVSSIQADAAGAYVATLALKEGPNAIALRLLSGTEALASSSYTVVFDKTPPGLLVTKPKAGDTVDGPNVVVEGKAEPGATVTVNDRTIVPAQDGSFTDTFPASAGALTITVVARDRAGNETSSKTAVTVSDKTTVATLSVQVTLDQTKVKPGALVNASIVVTANGQPKADEQVTLSVGVITIGSAKTNALGTAVIGFFAPPNDGDASVVVLATGASGRATLTVAK